MSNKPSNFDDDDFKFDDDDFKFDDDNDLDFDRGLGDELRDDELPPLDEGEERERRGPSRTFVIIAVLMILLFVGALVFLVFLIANQGLQPAQQTATAASGTIIAANATTFAQATETAAALIILQQTQTQEALFLTQTAQAPSPTSTVTLAPTVTPTATMDLTVAAEFALLTQAALDLTASAQPPTPTPSPTTGGVTSLEAVAQTATALAGLLVPTVEQGAFPTPTAEGGAPLPTALPNTGLFDDLATGSASPGVLALMVVGLLGLIVASRRLRASVSK